jgi:3-isopropylmalate/(R)-2-methylmalate dehydratase large subunit
MKTIFEKIWDKHVVKEIPEGPEVLYIDRHFIHEVTSPQAFEGLRQRGIKVFQPEKTVATADHNVPTKGEVTDPLSKLQLATLQKNCEEFGVQHFGLGHEHNGVVHIIGPELGLTWPGTTIVCGDSHTATHGAFGAIAFGIGTSEVEMVLASQCLLQTKAKTMRINVVGEMKKGVTAKDIILYIIAKLGTGGGTGYFLEYAGNTIEALSMEERMTICNMSIEMGSRGGLIAPDQTTFDYLKNRQYAPKGAAFDKAVDYWKSLKTDDGAVFDKEYTFDAADIDTMITYGTNPGMGVKLSEKIPAYADLDNEQDKSGLKKALAYMNFEENTSLINKQIDFVFIGSCTNGRIEDMRAAAEVVKGRKKAEHVTAWIVPGSYKVRQQAEDEGLIAIFNEAGIEVRQPGCSACLAMNDDKVPEGKYCVSTSNRNFQGRQGPGSRTLLASPRVAAAAAVFGKIVDPNSLSNN